MGESMDKEEQVLRQELQNTGVSVTRENDKIILNMPGHISFQSGSSRIKENFTPVLHSVAKVLNKYQNTSVEVSGHTDSQGSASSNQLLSEQRARGVARTLRNFGVDGRRIEAHGYGESQPLDTNKTTQGRQRNRRVEITLMELAH